jgi:alpha-ketoglutarate-dependent taurine dioxygenase
LRGQNRGSRSFHTSFKPTRANKAWIQAAFAEHPVLVFRDQDLGAHELAAFGRHFGVPRPHALTKYRHVDCPEVS